MAPTGDGSAREVLPGDIGAIVWSGGGVVAVTVLPYLFHLRALMRSTMAAAERAGKVR